MFLTISRTFKEGIKNFWRNGWLSFATVSVLMLSLFVVSVLMMITFSANLLLKNVQEKANISIYFKSDVTDEKVQEAQRELEKTSEIKSIDYVSKKKALENFKSNNVNEPAIIQSLEELGDNPLLASLVVRSKNPGQYESINEFINQADFFGDVSRVNYGKNKEIIEKLNGIIATTKKVGLSLEILFAVIAVLITFNTIRITIYSYKQEVEIMRLVGASNIFIRLPFVFEGLIYGTIASISSMLILFIAVKFAMPYLTSSIPPAILIDLYFSKFGLLFGLQIGTGTLLGIISSMIAIRRYLQI